MKRIVFAFLALSSILAAMSDQPTIEQGLSIKQSNEVIALTQALRLCYDIYRENPKNLPRESYFATPSRSHHSAALHEMCKPLEKALRDILTQAYPNND